MLDTSIRVERETRDRLKAVGMKGESYNAIIMRLLEERESIKYDWPERIE